MFDAKTTDMYRGFNLRINLNMLDLPRNKSNQDCLNSGNIIFDSNKAKFKEGLDSYVLPNGSLDGKKIKESWFPQVKADIFLSHSHGNIIEAKFLAGWLKEVFNVTTFIDSSVWGYANKLLEDIDDEYSRNSRRELEYKDIIYSSSHVHMMLATALSKMIDNTECLIFLNTPQSIKSYDKVDKTESPWIFYELAITEFIRKKSKAAHRPSDRLFSRTLQLLVENLKIEQEAHLGELMLLNTTELNQWKTRWNPREEYSLDSLYKIKPLKSNMING